MAREDFFDSLLLAHRLLPSQKIIGRVERTDTDFSGDPWLIPDWFKGFDPTDFADWPKDERESLKREVDALLAIARAVPPNEPATRSQSEPALRHLKETMKIVRNRLVPEWREAQEKMLEEVTAGSRAKGWYVEKDQEQIEQGLLGIYKDPWLLIRNPEKEVWFTPVARFCARRQCVVDSKISLTFERAFMVTYQDGRWQIVSVQGVLHKNKSIYIISSIR